MQLSSWWGSSAKDEIYGTSSYFYKQEAKQGEDKQYYNRERVIGKVVRHKNFRCIYITSLQLNVVMAIIIAVGKQAHCGRIRRWIMFLQQFLFKI